MTLPSPTHILGTVLLFLVPTSVVAQGVMTTKGQVVAKTGDAPLGLPAGVTLGTPTGTSVFDTPVMSANGMILIRSRLVGTGVTTLNERAMLLGHASGDIEVVLRAGDLDPSGTFPNSQVLQTSSGSGLPLGSNTFGSQRISPFGDILMFQAQLYDPTNTDGLITTGTSTNNQILYWGPSSGLQILARRAITTMADGAVLIPDTFSHQTTALNSAGIAVFKTTLSQTLGTPVPAVTAANDTAWIIGSPGALNYVIREGDSIAVPGGTAVQAALGFNCVLNEAGQILHDQTLSTVFGTPPATAANDKIVFITTGGVHTQFMREGDTVSDAVAIPIPGVFYGTPTLAQGFSVTGKAAFHCTMTGSVTTADDGAVFIGDPSLLQMVLREGDPAPGTGGETVASINSTMGFSDAGLVVGVTLVSPGIGVTTLNNSALYLCRANLPPLLIAREGNVAPGFGPGFVFGAILGGTDFGSSSQGRINDRGHVIFSSMRVNNGVTELNTTYSWNQTHGLQPQLVQGDTIGGQLVDFLPGTVLQFPSGDGSALGLTQDGDFVMTPQTIAANFIVRGHVGMMTCTPSSVTAAGGTAQQFFIDAGPTVGSSFYFVLATAAGTRPGFPSPIGPQQIPLNFDPLWTNLSISAVNSPIWVNTLGLTDANGVGLGVSGFVMPTGFPGFNGVTVHHAALFFDLSITSTFVTEPSALLLY